MELFENKRVKTRNFEAKLGRKMGKWENRVIGFPFYPIMIENFPTTEIPIDLGIK